MRNKRTWRIFESILMYRSSPPDVFLGKGVLKICSKFTGEHPCRSVISINLQSKFIEIALRHRCSPVHLLYIFRKPFPRNTSGWLLLYVGVGIWGFMIRIWWEYDKKLKYLAVFLASFPALAVLLDLFFLTKNFFWQTLRLCFKLVKLNL